MIGMIMFPALEYAADVTSTSERCSGRLRSVQMIRQALTIMTAAMNVTSSERACTGS